MLATGGDVGPLPEVVGEERPVRGQLGVGSGRGLRPRLQLSIRLLRRPQPAPVTGAHQLPVRARQGHVLSGRLRLPLSRAFPLPACHQRQVSTLQILHFPSIPPTCLSSTPSKYPADLTLPEHSPYLPVINAK